MTNKEKIKSVIEQDINPKNYYNEIIEQLEKGDNKKKNNIWKWSLVPICLIIVISGVLLLNYQNDNKTVLKDKTYNDKENDIKLNINEITDNTDGIQSLEANVKEVTNDDVNFPLPYKNGIVDIPKDLNKTNKYIFYYKGNKENEEDNSEEYNTLGNYEIIYGNGNDRSIKVSYSKDNKPAKNYYFSDKGSKTIINGIELKIYKLKNNYFTAFNYNGYNFDIETSKITEQELSNFLLSILK